jgi:hypothetical protein
MKRPPLLSALFALAALVGGCSRSTQANSSAPAKPTPQQATAARQEQASDRELLDQIPPPAKSRYMAIRAKASWDNPYLVVSAKTISLRIKYPPPPQSNVLPGTPLLQPENARKRVLEVRLADLPEALASLPEDSWPYGRVVALEEDPNEVRTNRVPIRRNVEATIETLNNLGVIVYEWPGLK